MSGRLLVLLLLAATAVAQFDGGSSEVVRRLRVRVSFGNNAPCDASTRVALIGNSGFAVAEGQANGECLAEFFDVPAGRYHLAVSGSGIANADTGDIEVSPTVTQELEVRAVHRPQSEQAGGASFIAANDLTIPGRAAKEFEKANHSLAKQDLKSAIGHLQKALVVYPNYAAAYNNLGALYLQSGDATRGSDALQKAIAIDDHLAPAYVNLARISLKANDMAKAESLLSKATALAPPDPTTLVLLAYAQIMDQHFDEAIATSRKAHSVGGRHASVHLASAHAFELKQQKALAAAELQVYLEEEPSSPQAQDVRKALATLQASQ